MPSPSKPKKKARAAKTVTKKRTPRRSATRKKVSSKAAAKNSLVDNINRRKRTGKSRAKSRSTISDEAYARMAAGWPARNKTAKKAKSQS